MGGLLLDVHFRVRLFLEGDGFLLLPHIPTASSQARVALRFGLTFEVESFLERLLGLFFRFCAFGICF